MIRRTQILFTLVVGLALTGTSVASSLDSAFYHLHQAVGLLEDYAGGGCPSGHSLGMGHLRQARGALRGLDDAGLGTLGQDLLKISNQVSVMTLPEIERIRSDLHALGTSLSLSHSDAWETEITTLCANP